MKYKVGDKVRTKSLDWYNENKDEDGVVHCKEDSFVELMVLYCNSILTITDKTEHCYLVKENTFNWTDEMIEGLAEEPIILNGKEVLLHLADIELPSGTTNIWECPEGYQFVDENGNVINATKIVLEKKGKEYPKTYDDCTMFALQGAGYKRALLLVKLEKLLTCRDAYWKIAGDEMGLGKPWEPDWEDEHQEKYIIGSWLGRIQGLEENFVSHPFAFPSEEMRDAFKENFDPDIEFIKELL